MSTTKSLLRRNKNTAYLDSVDDKNVIFAHLDQKIKSVEELVNEHRGSKNLLYFSVSKNDGYIDLLEMCLKSIVQYTPQINFEILFITEASFIPQISNLSCLSNFTYHFHEVATPEDGIRASINKLKVFDFEKINEFNKILFLDCDIICIKPLNEVFNKEFDENYLQVACNPDVTVEAFLKQELYFCLDYIPDDKKEYIKTYSPVPFNAGQFMFKNTNKMERHFANILWLSLVWPGVFFFEQSFMNFYFTLNGMIKKDILHNNVNFILVGIIPESLDDPDKEPVKPEVKVEKMLVKRGGKTFYVVTPVLEKSANGPTDNPDRFDHIEIDNYTFIHFIGFALLSDKKIAYMNAFMKRKNICQ